MENVAILAGFENAEYGIKSVVTIGKTGFHVSLFDVDVNASVATRIFGFEMTDAQTLAIDYAKELVA